MRLPSIGRAEAGWHDMSGHVVHVVRGASAREAYDNIISILADGRLEARNPFGAARGIAPDPAGQRCVCLSEMPVDQLGRIIARRLPPDRSAWHGIAFTKAFLAARGGGPILYAYDGTPQAQAMRALMRDAGRLPAPRLHPIWDLAPFVDLPGRGGTYLFEWEREWRHVGDLRFSPEDVAFLLMPEEYHEAAWGFFEDARRENVGPAYFCPYLDATWPRQRWERALRERRGAPSRRYPGG
ncbi:hypothetical protein [Methylobacterium bullatum]|uniref:Uncharacterized protein n=1 Tax=Methylobacterium bullatum TaxID=570505 RepID=A0A679JY07_9HYPH|nr:hypothetical protein MBLL_00392 [Methylobacterium bullatum]